MNEPAHLDEAINRVICQLNRLPWKGKILGRVWEAERSIVGKDRPTLIPRAHLQGSEYEDARPSDKFDSLLAFYPIPSEGEKADFYRLNHSKRHAIRSERKIHLLGWINLQQTAMQLERCKIDLYKALKEEPCVIRIESWLDGRFTEVWRPFELVDAERKYDLYPFACFRVEITLFYIEPHKNA
ncbi:hypothetical protein [Tellurirhabdus bombi]|uniref:hypothetical protein n=1 Tax=Tellurirhabdus bombi TaxID=2907205 RepID=UPI001F475190|nr:hypothetical protein [Tellurirhabdus bombi]